MEKIFCKAIKKSALFELFTYYEAKGYKFKAFSSGSLLAGPSFLISCRKGCSQVSGWDMFFLWYFLFIHLLLADYQANSYSLVHQNRPHSIAHYWQSLYEFFQPLHTVWYYDTILLLDVGTLLSILITTFPTVFLTPPLPSTTLNLTFTLSFFFIGLLYSVHYALMQGLPTVFLMSKYGRTTIQLHGTGTYRSLTFRISNKLY
jgi:hypothetical protein